MLIRLSDYMVPVKSLTKPHKGIVVDNVDPSKLGRVKCTVEGIYEAETTSLPWITPTDGDPKKVDIPKIGEELIIEFPYDDIYAPFYTGFWHSTANHDTYFDDSYPHTFGTKKDNIKMKFNDEAKTGEIVHSTGKNIELLADGSVNISLKDLTELLAKRDTTTETTLVENVGTSKEVTTGTTSTENIGTNKLITLKKLKIQNDTAEIIDLLTQLTSAMSGEPFLILKGTYADIATKLLTFKV